MSESERPSTREIVIAVRDVRNIREKWDEVSDGRARG
jgi:hypothetical protein